MVEKYTFKQEKNGLIVPFDPNGPDRQVIIDPNNPERKHHWLIGSTGKMGLFPEGERRLEAAIRWQQKMRWI